MKMNFTTLELTGKKLRWLDQTELPLKVIYKESDNYPEIITAIKRLEIRGAPAIGIAAAYGIAIALNKEKNSSIDFINKIATEFKNARPTAVNLFWAVDRMTAFYQTVKDLRNQEIIDKLFSEAVEIHSEDIRLCENIGKFGSELIKDGDTVLTHCNAGALATGGIGTALGVIYTCQEQGKSIKVYADETRPLLQGARLTAWELQQQSVDVTLICDNTAGMLLRQGKIDHIIVGADRIAKNGDFANKIGTYSVAVLARENHIPFYVAAPYSTFDDNINTGNEIVIEERSSSEVTHGFGNQTAPDNISVYSPAFDVTPAEYVSFYITDKGLTKGIRG